MAKFISKNGSNLENVENFEKRLRSNDVLSLLKEAEFNEFWLSLAKEYSLEIDMSNFEISDHSFQTIVKFIQDHKIDLTPFLSKNYNKDRFDCIALIEDCNLLNILRTCSKLLVEFDYPTFYY